ncbi:MAG: hypothetical protein HKM07_01785 [Chlamydiae bacterium]|nr:hypothetical protein [Chlamydiota bacterium]
MEEKTTGELLQELSEIVEILKVSLPKEAPLFFSKAIDPCRALHLREACFHRVTELAESAYEAFLKKNTVVGYILLRSIMETVALFWYFYDKITDAIKTQDVHRIREMLSKALAGAKAAKAKEAGWSLDPVHILKLIRHVAKATPPFEDHYDFLSEVAHPNAAGLISAYVKNDWDKKIAYFGKEHGKLGSVLAFDLGALIVILNSFMDLYDRSAQQLEKFQEICEVVLSNADIS